MNEENELQEEQEEPKTEQEEQEEQEGQKEQEETDSDASDDSDSNELPVKSFEFSENSYNDLVEKVSKIDELKDVIARMRDAFHGRIGGLEENARSFSGFSNSAKEKLAEEYPELSEILFQKSEKVEQPGVIAPVEPDEFTVDQKFELRLLKRDHNDWEQVTKSDEFNGWLGARNEADKFNTSWDADYLSSVLSEYRNQKQ